MAPGFLKRTIPANLRPARRLSRIHQLVAARGHVAHQFRRPLGNAGRELGGRWRGCLFPVGVAEVRPPATNVVIHVLPWIAGRQRVSRAILHDQQIQRFKRGSAEFYSRCNLKMRAVWRLSAGVYVHVFSRLIRSSLSPSKVAANPCPERSRTLGPASIPCQRDWGVSEFPRWYRALWASTRRRRDGRCECRG